MPVIEKRDASDPYSGVSLQYAFHYDCEESFRRERLTLMSQSCATVLDIGRSVRDDARLFAGVAYQVLSTDPDDKPEILADVCRMTQMIPPASFDGVICIAVLEHVYDPQAAIAQIHQVLRPGGLFFGYVPFLYSFHPKGEAYRDYFRFSEQGLAFLLREFQQVEIASVRGNLSTLVNLLPWSLKRLQRFCHRWDRRLSYQQVSGFNFFARKAS